jgi:hypothetical protein
MERPPRVRKKKAPDASGALTLPDFSRDLQEESYRDARVLLQNVYVRLLLPVTVA